MSRSRAEVLRMFSDFMETFDEFVEDDDVFWTLPDGREIPSERIDDFRRYSECVEAFRSLRLAGGESFIDMVKQNTTSTQERTIDFLQGARMFIDKLEVRRAEPARLTRQVAADPAWEVASMNIGGESKDALTFAPFDPEEDIRNLRAVHEVFRSGAFGDAKAAMRRLPGHSDLKDSIEELVRREVPEGMAMALAMRGINNEIEDVQTQDNMREIPVALVEEYDTDSDPELSAAYGEIDSDTLAEMSTDEDEENDSPPIARRLFPPEDLSDSDSEWEDVPLGGRLRF